MFRHSFTILILFDFAHDVHRFNGFTDLQSYMCSTASLSAAVQSSFYTCVCVFVHGCVCFFLFVPACKCMHTRAEKDKFEANKKNALKRLHTEHMVCTVLSQRQAAGRSRTRGAT